MLGNTFARTLVCLAGGGALVLARMSFVRRVAVAWALGWLLVQPQSQALAQLSPAEEQLQRLMSDKEALKKKLDKEKARPPLEFFRSQVLPQDALPFAKANQWFSLNVELRANHDDYDGFLETQAVPLLAMPIEVEFRRDARLVKGQRTAIAMQMMLPKIARSFGMSLIRPESIRADEIWPASLRVLEPHQMLVVVLTKGSNDPYAPWGRFQACNPTMVDRGDVNEVDRQRYYRFVLPLEPDRPLLPSHPLTWTSISHIIWDSMPPDRLKVLQRQALVDWLHWGGQLILVGGSAESFELLKDSFLAPYLPAEATGESVLLKQSDLEPLSTSYPPPTPLSQLDAALPEPLSMQQAEERSRRYHAPEPIVPASNRPVYLAKLRPLRPTASVISLGEGSPHVLGIEERVGHGRILMLALSPTDPALAAWPGIDTFVRRVVLRRPEEPRFGRAVLDEGGYHAPASQPLGGTQLSWYRLMSRDLGASSRRPLPYEQRKEAVIDEDETAPPSISPAVRGGVDKELRPSPQPVAEWVDSSTLPVTSRSLLENASGIKIPSAGFVLKVILAYLIALVPLNWLICRYLFGRREWAWVIVPALSLGFAIVVERASSYDVGYNSASDEIDVMELYGGYPRAHLSRFASYYSTGRVRVTISYPDDPTALALPMDTGHFLRGEDVSTAVWRSSPIPALEGFQIQPRSLAMFRAEQMINLSGTIRLETDKGPRKVVNETDFEVRDAVVIDMSGEKDRKTTYVGTLGPGMTVEVGSRPAPAEAPKSEAIDVEPVLKSLREHFENLPENSGEIRLVGWLSRPLGGQKLEPDVDRHRGFTAVVVHLKAGPAPSPDAAVYNALARTDGSEGVEFRPGDGERPPGARRRVRGRLVPRVILNSDLSPSVPVPPGPPPASVPVPALPPAPTQSR